jgi:seryl-tRNA synthetase
MLDIKLIRENPEAVKRGAAAKNVEVDVDAILKLDADRRALIGESEALKAEQNRASEEIAGEKDADVKRQKIEALRDVKERVKGLNDRLASAEAGLNAALRLIPNLPRPDVKVGKDDSENYVIREFLEPTKFDFEPVDYMTLGERLDIIDVERAGKVSGARFGYLKGDGALLEFALVQYAMQTLLPEGFSPVIPPVLVNEKTMGGMGYLDRGRDEIYHLPEDNLFLVGTSEQSIGAMHTDEVLREEELPRRYVGFSTCFRREAGSYGKDVRGILRVHQFDKVEMLSFTRPEDSDAEHELLRDLEERLLQGLRLPYHVLGICSGDLGDPAARKFDLEAWIPSQKTYRETHSTSTCTDYQARRLNMRLRRKDGSLEFLHTLNGTVFAVGRTIIAILENYQQADGTVRIPEVLVPFMHGRTVIEPPASRQAGPRR